MNRKQRLYSLRRTVLNGIVGMWFTAEDASYWHDYAGISISMIRRDLNQLVKEGLLESKDKGRGWYQRYEYRLSYLCGKKVKTVVELNNDFILLEIAPSPVGTIGILTRESGKWIVLFDEDRHIWTDYVPERFEFVEESHV